jgi:protein-disulfide isomerase
MNRRNILIGLGVVAVAAGGGAYWLYSPLGPLAPQAPAAAPGTAQPAATASTAAGDMPIFEDDRILGAADAPVTIIEYSSLTCPHCASFHRETLPQVKSEWIDSGRARLVYRHYPLDQLALRAAAAANCIEGNGFFGFLEVLFTNQQRWAQSQDPIAAVGQLAALAGLDRGTFESCLNDEASIDRILRKQTDGRDRYGIASTPSFVVNGTTVTGARSYEEFKSVLESAESAAS